MRALTTLRGQSGTGKGTRMSQILLFLQTKMESEFVYHQYIGGNKRGQGNLMERPYGVLFPEINTVFLGYWCKSRPAGQMFWQSMDGFVRNTFVKDDCVEQLEYVLSKFSIVADINKTAGTGVGEFMKNHNLVKSFDRVIYHKYYHVSKDEYVSRIVQRNGDDWGGKKKTFSGFVNPESEMKHFEKDLESKRDGDTYEMLDANTDYLYFGSEYLRFIGKEHWVSEFLEWSEDNSTKRTLGVENETIINQKEVRGIRVG